MILRNIYFNIARWRRQRQDIPDWESYEYANDLSIHGITKSNMYKDNIPVYNVDLSS